ITRRPVETTLEHPHQSRALAGIFESGFERIDVRGQPALAPHVVERILICREHKSGRQAQACCNFPQKALRRIVSGSRADTLIGKQLGCAPDGLAIAAPEAVERPARQRLAGIPLPLTEVREPRPRVLLFESLEEIYRQAALVRTQCRSVPFRSVWIVNGHEC